MIGRLRTTIMPNKYKQYQRIQDKATQIGNNAADKINNEQE